MKERPQGKSAMLYLGVALFILYIVVAFTAGAVLLRYEKPAEQIAIIELCLFSGFLVGLIFLKHLQAVVLLIARLKSTVLSPRPEILTSSKTKGGEASGPTPWTELRSVQRALRGRHGIGWRRRAPWLLLCGDDRTINTIAPGLDAVGIVDAKDTVLVHATPIGVDAILWRKEILTARPRRPIDALVYVVAEGDGLDKESDVLRRLAAMEEELRWSFPVVLLCPSVAQGQSGRCELAGVFFRGRLQDSTEEANHQVARALDSLERRQALDAIYARSIIDRSGAVKLSAVVGSMCGMLARFSKIWLASDWVKGRLSGAVFTLAGQPGSSHADSDDGRNCSSSLSLVWREIGAQSRAFCVRSIGVRRVDVFLAIAIAGICAWTSVMMVSGMQSSRSLSMASGAIQGIHRSTSPADKLRSLVSLQHQIDVYEQRISNHSSWWARATLNRDAEILAALRIPYGRAARQLLITPVQHDLEASLADLSQLRTTQLDDQTTRWAMAGRDTLKAYLMMANPARVEPDFLAAQMAAHWTTGARVTPGERMDMAERLANFYARHLKTNEAWKIDAREDLVAGARRTLLAVIGQTNAQDTLYRGILDGVGSKYPDLTLAQLAAGTDTRGLLRSSAVVPGVFTRQAYEGYVADAIDAAAKRRDIAADWVLSDDGADGQAGFGKTEGRDSADAMRVALTAQYFADYAEHWQAFMNALQWEAAPTLPASIAQLKQLTDARQSPVVALMKALAYQGGAGVQKASLAEALVDKTKAILGGKAEGASAEGANGPLDAAFGPVLRLAGQPGAGGSSVPVGSGDLSLQRYFDRATALRLRLQQITQSGDGDGQARQLAQALFQGKGSELGDTQAYAQLMAASLGAEWAGMGEALFVRPVAQAAQAVLRPAQASLNEAWRQHIAMAWGRAFAGRYPFASTENDASLPELARFLRPRDGLIHAFLGSQLAGVLELQGDQWVPVAADAEGLKFDPNFLKGINALQRIGSRLLVQGEPQFQFALKPIPTPGLTDTLMTVDGQTLHYFNQREAWHATRWPANNLQAPGTRLQWQTETAGTNKHYEFDGRWGWIRMLERADVEPIDSATFQLTWQGAPDTGAADKQAVTAAPDSLTAREAHTPVSAAMAYPIRYQMRTEAGHGPLELLALRGFVLPSRIFADSGRHSLAQASATASH
ncbi:ImcF-related family protein [Cupriavidus sp. U2]|uniref:ImcF-related family protein n=1 Tax=Cupriavidus sp. U2 TaxID=2920269 RepID=UPI001E55D5F8|nr:ImcF-related family protein [Cupriavidus sp. U2]